MKSHTKTVKLFLITSVLLLSACATQTPFHKQSTEVWSKERHSDNPLYTKYLVQLNGELKKVWRQRVKAGKYTADPSNTAKITDKVANNLAAKIAAQLTPADGAPKNCTRKGTVLLLHGLYDSPYVMRDLGKYFNEQCFTTRFLLLPYHGTQPGDMLDIDTSRWVKSVEYAVTSMKDDYKDSLLFIAGFSTGGGLAINHALKNNNIDGLFLFAPLIDVGNLSVTGAYLFDLFGQYIQVIESEADTYKYESTTTKSVIRTGRFADGVRDKLEKSGLNIPVFLTAAKSDYTLPTAKTLQLFNEGAFGNRAHFLLFDPDVSATTPCPSITTAKPRELIRCGSQLSNFEQTDKLYQINDYSHMALTIQPDNEHYGLGGRYKYCHHYSGEKREQCKETAKDNKKQICEGERNMLGGAHQKGNCDSQTSIIRRLTSNPRFDVMASHLTAFIQRYIDPLLAQ